MATNSGSGFVETGCSLHQVPASAAFGADMCSNAKYSSFARTSNLLLRLPRELRDEIYEFALTLDGEGLYCRPGLQSSESLEKKKEFNMDNGIQGVEQYFGTPINLRMYQSEYDDTEANQLKYVCRQFRQETKGLELAYNSIVFCGKVNTFEKVAQGERFLRNCGEGWKRHIRRITLRDQAGVEIPRTSTTSGSQSIGPKEQNYPFEMHQSIISFASDHPKAEVHFQFGRNNLPTADNVLGLFLVGVMFNLRVRDALSSVITSPGRMHAIFPEGDPGTEAASFWIHWLRKMPNFRMSPHPTTYGVELLRERFSDPRDMLVLLFLPSVIGGAETWVSIYKSWFEKGI